MSAWRIAAGWMFAFNLYVTIFAVSTVHKVIECKSGEYGWWPTAFLFWIGVVVPVLSFMAGTTFGRKSEAGK